MDEDCLKIAVAKDRVVEAARWAIKGHGSIAAIGLLNRLAVALRNYDGLIGAAQSGELDTAIIATEAELAFIVKARSAIKRLRYLEEERAATYPGVTVCPSHVLSGAEVALGTLDALRKGKTDA